MSQPSTSSSSSSSVLKRPAPSSTSPSCSRKRVAGDSTAHLTTSCNVLHGGVAAETKDNDFLCPICFGVVEEAHVAKCGHSFCFKCIMKSLKYSAQCPTCRSTIGDPSQLFPNHSLNDMALKFKRNKSVSSFESSPTASSFRRYPILNDLAPLLQRLDADTPDEGLELRRVDELLRALTEKKAALESRNELFDVVVLKEFLSTLGQKKQQRLDQLQNELNLITGDIEIVHEMEAKLKAVYSSFDAGSATATPDAAVHGCKCGSSPLVESGSEEYMAGEQSAEGSAAAGESVVPCDSDKLPPRPKPSTPPQATPTKDSAHLSGEISPVADPARALASRKRKLHSHFEELQAAYFDQRLRDEIGSGDDEAQNMKGIHAFRDCLAKFTRFSSLRPLATLNYAADICNSSNIVSSIEFDRSGDHFAIAGVTRRIKIFEYDAVIKDLVDIHYPIAEMSCNSKISCVSWNYYHRGVLASSDYEGTVSLWDAFTGCTTRQFQEHEKRCWSCDFSVTNPKLLVSGSDDHQVKLWSTNQQHSVHSITAAANVCCVKFSPEDAFKLVFGSADHCVYLYDLRKIKTPLKVYKGHRKAVSYTRFLTPTTLVSASTDSQLKLWDAEEERARRSFSGHVNEKNFVGLTTDSSADGDYIACGSENNTLYVYYKGLSKTLTTFKFDSNLGTLDGRERPAESSPSSSSSSSDFVSAVTWKHDTNVLVAANSLGAIKILELVP